MNFVCNIFSLNISLIICAEVQNAQSLNVNRFVQQVMNYFKMQLQRSRAFHFR